MGLFGLGKSTNDVQDFEQKKLADWIKTKVQEVRQGATRVAYEGIWMTNIAYLKGYNSVYFDTTARQFRTLNRPQVGLPRNRLQSNIILSTIQNRLSRLIKSRPKFQVRPNSNDQKDKDASKLSEQILDMIWQSEEMASKQIDLYMWLQQCGHAYLKVCWDESMGKQMSDPMTGEIDYEGGIRIDVVSAFEVYPDPLAKNLRDAQWVIQAKVRKLEYFKTQYPGVGEQVREEDTWLLSAQFENRINNMSAVGTGQSATQIAQRNTAIELTYYEKRSSKHPNGRQVVSANGVILEDKDLPVGDIPFIKFDDVVVAGSYYPESIITHLRPLQDQYNRALTKRAQWTNKLLTGKYLVARGSQLTAESLNDQSGEVVEYTPVPNAAPPTFLQVPTIPEYAYKEEESIKGNINEISGINEVSRGQGPGSGITAAIALQYLSEQDDTRIGAVSRRFELGMARFGRLILMYAERYFTTPQLLKMAGQNMEYTVKEFLGEDIGGNTDVVVIEGSTLPGSTTAKRDFILTIMNQGLLGNPTQDPKAREKVLKLLEYGDVGGLWEDYSLDMNQIKRSVDQIEEGIQPQISELDNNALHIQEKNKIRKSEKFDMYPPEIQTIFMSDIEARIHALMDQANPGLAIQEQHADMQVQEAQEDAANATDAPPPMQTLDNAEQPQQPIQQGQQGQPQQGAMTA